MSQLKNSKPVIFGRKTDLDENGIFLVTNENGLSDLSNIRIAISDYNDNTPTPYCRIKIIN